TMKIHRYYKCVTAKKKQGCKRKSVKKDWIERLVIEYVLESLFDDALMESIADKLLIVQKRENTNLPLMKKQLAETQKSIDNILDAIQQGIFNASTKGRLDELEEVKERLTIGVAREEIINNFITKEKVLFWLHRFRDTDVTDYAQKQRLVDSFVNAVYIYDDRIVMLFNYKDGSKTVSLADIEGSDFSSLTAPNKIIIRASPLMIISFFAPNRLKSVKGWLAMITKA
ncbi:MAG: zinc ribbon domain-containing protein, partial [Clostridiales Family XIII bacterium]|nr:zinc ribbon domain-containing protein [Clostridiales Family XIII bacterium]